MKTPFPICLAALFAFSGWLCGPRWGVGAFIRTFPGGTMRPTANLLLLCTRSLCPVLRVITMLFWRHFGVSWVPGFEGQLEGRIRKIRRSRWWEIEKNAGSRKRCRKVGAWPEINT